MRINPSKVHMFRFLLEAQDNLGIMSVVDRWGAILQVRFSPHQEKEVREFLDGMRQTVYFEDCFTSQAAQGNFVNGTLS